MKTNDFLRIGGVFNVIIEILYEIKRILSIFIVFSIKFKENPSFLSVNHEISILEGKKLIQMIILFIFKRKPLNFIKFYWI